MSVLNTLFVTDILHIFVPTFDKPTRFPMNNRETFGICFAQKGEVIYHHNNKTYICHKSQAVIMPKGATYSLECNSDGSFPLVNFLATDCFTLNEFVEIPLENPEFYMNLFSQLERAYSMRNINGNTECLAILYKIINQLNREDNIRALSQIGGIMEYINKNFCNCNIDNSLLAKQANLSVSHFRSLFKKNYNVSPMNYIQSLRIEKATQLLLNPKFTVTAVAEECGFSSLYSFSRAFKTNIGISPSEFAKQNTITTI